LTVPSLHGFGEMIDPIRAQTQRFADITDGVVQSVSNGRSRQGRAFAAIFLVHVLDSFFAALMLKIHIDVGWLVAFPGDKSLE
jgi:hypothetical protein